MQTVNKCILLSCNFGFILFSFFFSSVGFLDSLTLFRHKARLSVSDQSVRCLQIFIECKIKQIYQNYMKPYILIYLFKEIFSLTIYSNLFIFLVKYIFIDTCKTSLSFKHIKNLIHPVKFSVYTS